jgi:hypothetical protein
MPNFLSRKQFSKALNVSISTLVRRIKDGVWPYTAYVRIGKSIRYPESLLQKIEALSRQNEVQSDTTL